MTKNVDVLAAVNPARLAEMHAFIGPQKARRVHAQGLTCTGLVHGVGPAVFTVSADQVEMAKNLLSRQPWVTDVSVSESVRGLLG